MSVLVYRRLAHPDLWKGKGNEEEVGLVAENSMQKSVTFNDTRSLINGVRLLEFETLMIIYMYVCIYGRTYLYLYLVEAFT